MKQHSITPKVNQTPTQPKEAQVSTDQLPKDLKPFPKLSNTIPQHLHEDRLCFVRGYN